MCIRDRRRVDDPGSAEQLSIVLMKHTVFRKEGGMFFLTDIAICENCHIILIRGPEEKFIYPDQTGRK